MNRKNILKEYYKNSLFRCILFFSVINSLIVLLMLSFKVLYILLALYAFHTIYAFVMQLLLLCCLATFPLNTKTHTTISSLEREKYRDSRENNFAS